jgi:hypothetical protein
MIFYINYVVSYVVTKREDEWVHLSEAITVTQLLKAVDQTAIKLKLA